MTRLFIACAIVSLVLLSISSAAAADKETLLQLVENGFTALNAKDIAAFEKLHVTDETPVHIDAGEGQIHVGWTASKKSFEEFMKTDFKFMNQKNIALNVDGNSAWGVWTFDSQMSMEGKPMTHPMPMRLTLVFKGSGGKWLVAHSHVSAGLTPPPPTQ